MLAIGISHENEGFCSSRFLEPQEIAPILGNLEFVDEANRKFISAELQKEFDMKFDEFIVVKGDEVIDHWRAEGDER